MKQENTLITLCRQNYAELKIICDKNANLAKELSVLADNVLCIYKNEPDVDNMTIYMGRHFGRMYTNSLVKYNISDATQLFYCNNGIEIDRSRITSAQKIGSMKEYWRNTYNSVDKTDKYDKRLRT